MDPENSESKPIVSEAKDHQTAPTQLADPNGRERSERPQTAEGLK